MPKINIQHETQQKADDSWTAVKNFFETDLDIKKIDPKMQFQFDESAKKGTVKSSQFKAEFSIAGKGTGSALQLMIDLPLLLTPFKGKVEEIIRKKLAKYLA